MPVTEYREWLKILPSPNGYISPQMMREAETHAALRAFIVKRLTMVSMREGRYCSLSSSPKHWNNGTTHDSGNR